MHIIESGLMYTVSVVILVVVYLASNNAQYAVSDCIVQIIGIAFNLIIIRIDQGSSIDSEASFISQPSTVDKPERSRSLRFRFSGQAATCTSVMQVGANDGDYAGQNHAIAMMAFKPGTVPSLPDKPGAEESIGTPA
ncbi:hypothetical protein GSI_03210 [Ganoderma sinense ZZ0214-1]|uniref:Uncharacterized protein n=1 Tax=Ganoderma sinense ZZ0214-1 TaxID=1077348 RepID=A0A2G8SKZ1_9APHY|nr:hypothetical protein GSI_03210 [Ganoderma sinense ZZ0214-1]